MRKYKNGHQYYIKNRIIPEVLSDKVTPDIYLRDEPVVQHDVPVG